MNIKGKIIKYILLVLNTSKHNIVPILVISSILLCIIGSFLIENPIETRFKLLSSSYKEMATEKANLLIRYNNLTTEYNNFKNKIENNDIDKKAIVSYIKTNFKKMPIEVVQSIADNLIDISVRNNIPYELIMGMVEVESNFNPSAVSSKGARGLLQVMPSIWKDTLGLEDEYDLHQIKTGLEHGVKILTIILNEQKGNMPKALYHYVGKNEAYVNNVYKAMGEFMLHRSLLQS